MILLVGNGPPGAISGPVDEDSRKWWSLASELSADAMEGRDTGSGGYERAARLVAERMAAAGLQPLGDNGTFFQRIAFSEREVSILRLLAGGYSNREIAKAVFLSEGTVKNYVSDILDKLGTRDRTRAVLKAITLRII